MPISMKIKTVYTAVVILVQIYFVYAATLFAGVSMSWVVLSAAVSALGTIYYVFVLANKDEVGGYNGDFSLDERRRL